MLVRFVVGLFCSSNKTILVVDDELNEFLNSFYELYTFIYERAVQYYAILDLYNKWKCLG